MSRIKDILRQSMPNASDEEIKAAAAALDAHVTLEVEKSTPKETPIECDFDFLEGGVREKYVIFKLGDGNLDDEIIKFKGEKDDYACVKRVDPHATYLVLRLDTDHSARVAAEAYANHVGANYNMELSEGIKNLLRRTVDRFLLAQVMMEEALLKRMAAEIPGEEG